MKIRQLLLFGLMALCLAGCKTKKPITPQPAIKVNPTQSLVQNILEQQPVFASAQASKVKMMVDYQERKVSASGTINILTDSAIVLSVQPILGIELLRMELTKNNVMLIDKMNRRYVSMTFAELQKELGYPVTFSDVQALFTERLFVVGHDNQWLTSTPLEKGTEGENISLSFVENKIKYRYLINPASYRITQTQIGMEGQVENGMVTYANISAFGDVNFPASITINLNMGSVEATCALTLQKVTFNQGANVAPSSVSKYTKTSLSTIIPM